MFGKDAPIINEFPICLECEFIEYQDDEYGAGVIGKVVNVTADETIFFLLYKLVLYGIIFKNII